MFAPLALATVLALALIGCALDDADRPVVVGYMGGLSGRASSLGIAGRDGAQLAVEQVNARGGIHGDPVVFVAADDGIGPDSAPDAFRSLVDKGAVAVVGPVTSASAVTAKPIADELEVPMLSPSVSSGDLTGIDDYFLRIYPDNKYAGSLLASETVSGFGHRRISVIYDLSNRSYAETQYLEFREAAERLGAVVPLTVTFTSGKDLDYSSVAKQVAESNPECVLIIANAIDTGMLCQRLRAAGSSAHVIATPWSGTDDLISTGGSAVEGLLYLDTIDPVSEEPRFKTFVTEFQSRFGYRPGFSAAHAYEAMVLVLEAAERGPEPEGIKKYLTSEGPFQGLQVTIEIDRYGDAIRPYFPMVVKEGIAVPERR
ncbi:MAG: ABC transporter substrate-binding protein [Coriobacteriia bacterium]